MFKGRPFRDQLLASACTFLKLTQACLASLLLSYQEGGWDVSLLWHQVGNWASSECGMYRTITGRKIMFISYKLALLPHASYGKALGGR